MRSAGNILLTCVFLAVIIGGLWYMSRTTGSATDLNLPEPTPKKEVGPPPTPESFRSLQPELRSLIEKHLALSHDEPQDADPRGTLGMIYHANEILDLAAKAYAQASQLEPLNPKWIYLRGIVHELRGDLDVAISDMREVTRLQPDFGSAFLRLGLFEMQAGNLSEATTALQFADRLQPDDPVTTTAVAELRIRTGSPHDAPVLLEPILAADPDDAYARHVLANAYEALGDADKAAAMRVGSSPQREPWYDTWTFRIPKYRVKESGEATATSSN